VRSGGQSAAWLQSGDCVLTYGEEKFEVPVLLLKHVDGFKVAKEALVVPRVARVMNLLVGPLIGEEYLSGIGTNVGESIKDVSRATSQFLSLY